MLITNSGAARIPMRPAIRRAIEEGDGWTETKGLWCIVCGDLAHREIADPHRIGCYKCSEVTHNPDASFTPMKPLEIRPGQPLPLADNVDWDKVSSVHVYSEVLDNDLRVFLTEVIKHRKGMQGMNPDAIQIIRHMVS